MELSFSISPSNEYSRLISCRINRLDLLVVHGTLKSSPTPQFKSINPLVFSLLYGPALMSVQDKWRKHCLYGPLTIWTFVDKVMSLLFNVQSRLIIAFLPRSKCLFNFVAAVILEPPKISLTVCIVSPSICREMMGCHDLGFLNVEF